MSKVIIDNEFIWSNVVSLKTEEFMIMCEMFKNKLIVGEDSDTVMSINNGYDVVCYSDVKYNTYK